MNNNMNNNMMFMEKDVFRTGIEGVFGKFKTKNSFEINYLLTNMRMNDLMNLETATDAFDFTQVDFAELIQRDIDYDRVYEKIVDGYLKNDKDRVIFFPPLIVSLMAFENDVAIDLYEEVATTIRKSEQPNERDVFVKTWDKDKFRIELILFDSSTGHTMQHEGKQLNYINYAAALKYNKDKVKLVVIDGQHRFVALRDCYNSGIKDDFKNIEMPVCLFFSPDAVKGTNSHEEIKRDMRELFVTINNTSKLVSGHFTTLLNDKTISAMCVRSLADKWKSEEVEPSKLHLLEWNERTRSRANQRNKVYSVTTVSIVDKCLESVFDSSAESMLKLLERERELEGDECSNYNEIKNDNFTLKQAKVLEEQVDKYITPSLDILFFKPTPYQEVWNKFKKAIEWLNKEIEGRSSAHESFKDDYLYKFRDISKKRDKLVNTIQENFEKKVAENKNNSVYFLNVFQQGMIRAWYELSLNLCRGFEVDSEHIADSLVESLEILCFKPSKKYFDDRNTFLQQVVFSGQRVLINGTAKTCWMNLIVSLFVDKKTRDKFVEILKKYNSNIDDADLSDKLIKLARKNIGDHFKVLESKVREDISSNWKYKDYEREILDKLTSNEGLDNAESKRIFKETLDDQIDKKVGSAKDEFANVYNVSTKSIFSKL